MKREKKQQTMNNLGSADTYKHAENQTNYINKGK